MNGLTPGDGTQGLNEAYRMEQPRESAFDRVKRLAARLFDVPSAAISLVRQEREWFQTHWGLEFHEAETDGSFCRYALSSSPVFVMLDALADARFAGNALVVNGQRLRFYAGAPLIGNDGSVLGTLCVVDSRPRGALTEEEQQTLVDLAAIVVDELELRKALSERRAEQEARQQREFELRLALSAGRMGIWIWDLVTGKNHWTQTSVDDAPPIEVTTEYETFLAWIHEEDRERLAQQFAEAVESKSSYSVEFRMLLPYGETVWVMNQGSVLCEQGVAVRVVGVTMDVSERKQIEQTLRQREEMLETIVGASPDVISILGLDGTILWESDASLDMLGYESAVMVGANVLDFVHPDDHNYVMERLSTAPTDPPLVPVRCRVRHANGRWVEVETRGRAILDAEGATSSLVIVTRDITQQARMEEVVRGAKEKAEEANRAKSEFLSRMSHELRTPMNAILGFAQILEMDELTADQRESVGHILKGGQHLLELINDVLDITRVEAGRFMFSMEAVQLGEVVQAVLDLMQPVAVQHGVRIPTFLQEGGELYVMADRQRLKQVLLNLIANAVKYNREGREVRIAAREQGSGAVRLAVADTGIGIPAHRLDDLFAPFQRLEMETSEIEGTGLGLVLSKNLVEAMNGTIGVESAMGRGTTFWLELERAEVSFAAPQGVETVREGAHSYKVLTIEENRSNQKLVEQILARRPQVRLYVASSGREGLDVARQLRPHLILLDLHLPDLNADELLGLLWADPRTEMIPVVVIGEDGTNHPVQRMVSDRVRYSLTKPLDVQAFLRVLDDILREREGVV